MTTKEKLAQMEEKLASLMALNEKLLEQADKKAARPEPKIVRLTAKQASDVRARTKSGSAVGDPVGKVEVRLDNGGVTTADFHVYLRDGSLESKCGVAVTDGEVSRYFVPWAEFKPAKK